MENAVNTNNRGRKTVKKFPSNHNISLNMKKKKEEVFDINKLIQNDELARYWQQNRKTKLLS